jgi:hypothetical protein
VGLALARERVYRGPKSPEPGSLCQNLKK